MTLNDATKYMTEDDKNEITKHMTSTSKEIINTNLFSEIPTSSADNNIHSLAIETNNVINPALCPEIDRGKFRKLIARINVCRIIEQLRGFFKKNVPELKRSEVKDKVNANSSIGYPEGLSPIEEYLQMMERIISDNKLSPRRIQRLKEIMQRYQPCEEHESAMCNIPTCQQSRIVDSSQSFIVTRNNKENCTSTRYSLIDIGTFELVEQDTSKSLDDRIATNTSEPEKINFRIIQATDKYKDQNLEESDTTLKKISSETTKVSLDMLQKDETNIQQIQASVMSDFEDLLKDACNLESLTIDNTFSDFSLQHNKQDKIFQEHIDAEGILEQSKLLFYESEPSTSKSIIRSSDKKNGKNSVHFAEESTKEETNIPVLTEEIEVPKEKNIVDWKICICQ